MKNIPVFFFLLFFAMKSSSQQIIWEKSIGGSSADIGYSLLDANGKIIGLGSTSSRDFDVVGLHATPTPFEDFWLFQIDSFGNLFNQRCIGGSFTDEGKKIIKTNDGGYMMTGFASSGDGDIAGSGTVRQKDYWLAKTDSTFNIEWGRLIGGGLSDLAKSIIQTSDSGFLIVGSSYNFGGYVLSHYGSSNYPDIFIAKVSKSGIFEWGKTLGGSLNDTGIDVAQTSDNGYVVLGMSISRDYDIPSSSVGEIVFFKLDSIGNIQFVKTYGGTNGETVSNLIKEDDGSFVIIGSTGSGDGDVVGYIGLVDIWVLKVNNLGDIIWQKCLGSHGWEETTTAIKTNDNGYLIGATSFWGDSIIQNYSNFEDCWLVKIDSIGNYQWSKIFGGSHDDNVHSIIQVSDHDYVFTGSTESYDFDVSNCYGIPNCYEDVWIVKLSDGFNKVNDDLNFLSDLSAFYDKNNLVIRFISKNNVKSTFRVLDLLGNTILSRNVDCNQGLNLLSIPFDASTGLYILNLTTNNSKQSIKLFIN